MVGLLGLRCFGIYVCERHAQRRCVRAPAAPHPVGQVGTRKRQARKHLTGYLLGTFIICQCGANLHPPPRPAPPLSFPWGGDHLVNTNFSVAAHCVVVCVMVLWGTATCIEAGSDPRGHLGVTWGVYLCAGKPPLADIILSHPPDLTRCDSVIGWAIPAMSGHIQYRGTASGDLYIGISGINRVLLS